jgi:hypothetical protein
LSSSITPFNEVRPPPISNEINFKCKDHSMTQEKSLI